MSKNAMSSNAKFITWDLHEIVNDLVLNHPQLTKIYLFGSRSYKTNSFRSDIDILGVTENDSIAESQVNSWLHDKYPPVDLFLSDDLITARSAVNGSIIRYIQGNKWGFKNLIDQLDTKLIWEKDCSYSREFTDWNQQTLNGINFAMSIIPSYSIPDFAKTVKEALQSLEASGIKTFYAGSDWIEISKTIISLIKRGLTKPLKYQRKATNFSFDMINIQNEYDFQNMIHFILKPVFPDIASEPFVIKLDGNNKNADFAIGDKKIVIEAKWIDTVSKKSEVVKTLDGLSNFYTQNPNIHVLIFLILCKKDVRLDKDALEKEFSYENSTPPIFVRFLESDYSD